ncbi:J domain-containing protein [Halovivax gelatinilyticus]|uniref:J domain-containing protein n=1 Tax=Halovivax gelatinilyticus TaxID=2961597 RepID=UPI0020CA4657|nr:DnaJ domain-containing protein [Halovivax gelatinilyticus]
MTEDFYDLLDVPTDATPDEIKTAFREQVRIYHPDLNDDERAQAQFSVLKTAYDVLSDPVERQAYDRLGHRSYVAKRTSGIPSPDTWITTDRTDDAGSEPSSVETNSESWSSVSTSTGTTSRADGTTGSNRSGSASRTSVGERATRSGGYSTHTADRTGSNAFVRWWRSKNFALPLLWIATIVYLVGIVQYGLQNADAFRALRESVSAAGIDGAAQWEVLTADTYGLVSGYATINSTDFVAPPVASTAWYGALVAGNVAVVALLCAYRIRYRGDTYGPVTMNETIALAAAVGSSAVLVGGPLLAGALLLPLLYGVVIYHSHRIPGWSPSYAYLVAVTMPLGALAAGWLGETSVSIELLALVLLPVAGALGLPIRFAVRRRFGI